LSNDGPNVLPSRRSSQVRLILLICKEIWFLIIEQSWRFWSRESTHRRRTSNLHLVHLNQVCNPSSLMFCPLSRKDATLKELSDLIKEVHSEASRRDVRFSFNLVYQDNLRGSFVMKELGTVSNSRPSHQDEKTLDDARFVTGDFLDVAILTGSDRENRGGRSSYSGSSYSGQSYGRYRGRM
jgi:hypothetical protein